jgi:hypothetical protein
MNIWVPKTKILEPRDPIVPPKSGVAGYFRIEGFRPDGRRRVLSDWKKNLITDGGLHRWAAGAPIAYCSVGSGTTPPANSDIALETFVAQHDSIPSGVYGAQSTAPYYGWTRWVFRFNPPGTEHTISEFGTGWGTNGTDLWSHAAVSPAVTWLDDETLEITYEMRVYPPTEDRVYETLLAGAVREGVIRAMDVDNGEHWRFYNNEFRFDKAGDGTDATTWVTNGMVMPITQAPLGTEWAACTIISQDAYNNNYKRKGTVRLESEEGNLTDGISVIYHVGYGQWQMSVDPAIEKISGTTLTLNVETMIWGRYTAP